MITPHNPRQDNTPDVAPKPRLPLRRFVLKIKRKPPTPPKPPTIRQDQESLAERCREIAAEQRRLRSLNESVSAAPP